MASILDTKSAIFDRSSTQLDLEAQNHRISDPMPIGPDQWPGPDKTADFADPTAKTRGGPALPPLIQGGIYMRGRFFSETRCSLSVLLFGTPGFCFFGGAFLEFFYFLFFNDVEVL